jgi:type I restriction enzyme, R subunit
MSELLADLVRQRRDDAIAYAEYLERIAALVKDIKAGHGRQYPMSMDTPGKKALFDNLDKNEGLAAAVDAALRATAPHGWRGHPMKERKVRRCLEAILPDDVILERVMEILKHQHEY